MSRKWDYKPTEDGGLRIAEYYYHHANAEFWKTEEYHAQALRMLGGAAQEEDVDKYMRLVRVYRAEMNFQEKQRAFWYDRVIHYDGIPF